MLKALSPLTAALLLLMVCAAPATAGPDMQEGLWQITTTFEMPGMPTQMPPVTHTQCITQDDLVPQAQQQPGQECQVSSFEVVGNSVSYDMVCTTAGNKMQGHGEAIYSGASMSGSMQMTITGQGGMTMTYQYSGERIGPCN